MEPYQNPGLESRRMSTRRIAKAKAHAPGFSPGFPHGLHPLGHVGQEHAAVLPAVLPSSARTAFLPG